MYRLAAVALFLAATAPAAPPDIQQAAAGVREVIGHQGSCKDRPGNTLVGVRRAIEAGAHAIEVDIRTTKDGVLVCLHDADLAVATDGTGTVGTRTRDDLKRLDAGGKFAKEFAGERVPTLREVFALCKGKVGVMLDLKEDGDDYARRIVADVKGHGEPERVILGVRSADQARLFRRLLPKARQIGLIPTRDDVGAFAEAGVDVVRLWPKWLPDAGLVEKVRKAGVQLHLGTGGGTPDEVRPLLAYAPESLSADDPARLVKTLAELTASGEPKPFPGIAGKWNGFARHDFKAAGTDAIVVVPEKPLPGRPWVWRGEFFGAFADADVALVKAGWHLAYLKVPDRFGSPDAVAKWEEFHAMMVKEHGMHPRPGLIGLSRGGLYCMNWAAAHPDRTLAIYLDNAVCDFKSWPGGKPKSLGTGKGSADEWTKLLKAYGFKSDEEAVAFKLNPVDNLAPLAKAGVPLLLVYGDADTVVPAKENSDVVFDRYRALGGKCERVVKPGQDHHPHGLKDVTPVVEFFTKALGKGE